MKKQRVARRSATIAHDSKWITVKPNGPDKKGTLLLRTGDDEFLELDQQIDDRLHVFPSGNTRG